MPELGVKLYPGHMPRVIPEPGCQIMLAIPPSGDIGLGLVWGDIACRATAKIHAQVTATLIHMHFFLTRKISTSTFFLCVKFTHALFSNSWFYAERRSLLRTLTFWDFTFCFCRIVRCQREKNSKKSGGTYRYLSLKWILHDLRPPLLKWKEKINWTFHLQRGHSKKLKK